MIKLISTENIKAIEVTAVKIVELIKAKKFYFTSEYNDDARVKGSDSLVSLFRAFSQHPHHRMNGLGADKLIDSKKLEVLVSKLSKLLDGKVANTCHKIKDYTKGEIIKPKLCRELISDLEDLLIIGDISLIDIDDVYATIKKPTPKKFKGDVLSDGSQDVYRAIKHSIKDKGQEIKANSMQHYMDMVKRIDPNDEIKDRALFLKACRSKMSDINAMALCMVCKFSSDKFQSMINESFDSMVITAACRITDHYRGDSKKPVIEVRSMRIGAKGFNIVIWLDNQTINARAVPVNGYFVRFHYRYIIT